MREREQVKQEQYIYSVSGYKSKEQQITWNMWWCGSRRQHKAGQVGAYGPEVTAVSQPAVECSGDDLVLHGGTQ